MSWCFSPNFAMQRTARSSICPRLLINISQFKKIVSHTISKWLKWKSLTSYKSVLKLQVQVTTFSISRGMQTEMTTRKMAVVADFPLNTFFCFENRKAHYAWRSCLPVAHLHIHWASELPQTWGFVSCMGCVRSSECQTQPPSYMRTQNLLNPFGGTILLLGVLIEFELNLAPQLWISWSSKGPGLLPFQTVTGHCPLGRARKSWYK